MGKVWFFLKKYSEVIFVSVVIFLILNPYILGNGYFLWIDWVFWPEIFPVDWQYYPNYIPWIYIFSFISSIFWTIITQKIILISCFLLAYFSSKKILSFFWIKWGIVLFWFLFFVCNPFVYWRLLQWQIYILYAYALLPFCLYFLFKNKYIYFWIVAGLLISFSPHAVFFLIVFLLLYVLIFFKKIKRLELFFAWIIIFIINFYWMFSILTDSNIVRFSMMDFSFFQSRAINFPNVYLEVLSLSGFWWDSYWRYLVFDTTMFSWFVYLIFLFSFSCFWLVSYLENDKYKKYAVFMVFSFIFSYILSLGASEWNIFYDINFFFFNSIPFYSGMREPNKWSAVLVVIYLITFFKWIQNIIQRDTSIKKYVYILLVMFLGFSPMWVALLFNFALKTSQYPTEWYWVKEKIYCNDSVDSNTYSILPLPWHQSLYLDFANNQTINNPTGVFFGKCVLVPDNIEFGNIYSQSVRKESKIIEKYIWPKGKFREKYNPGTVKNFLDDIKNIGIKHIFLMKTADYKFYEDIVNQLIVLKKIELLEDTPSFKLYKIIL